MPIRSLPVAALTVRSIPVAVLIALTALSAVPANAQSGGGYLIKKSTIDGGGYTYHTGGGYKLGGTVGQHDAGPISGGGYLLTGGFWSPAADSGPTPSAPTADPSGLDKTRFISFVVPGANGELRMETPLMSPLSKGGCVADAPSSDFRVASAPRSDAPLTRGDATPLLGSRGTDGAAMAAGETALRVRLVSLHHVEPLYTGGTSVAFTLFEGQAQYVGPPVQYTESGSSPPSTDFYAAQLQCTPYYQDWSTVGLLHVSGEAIVPSSTYNVENLAASCAGNEAICTAVSAPLSISTTRWADVDTPYQNPFGAPDQPAFGDISALKNKFASSPTAPIKARSLLAGDVTGSNRGLIDISAEVNFTDISLCVDAFQGKPYPYKPGKCTGDPAKACISDADCTAQSTTGPCVLCE